MSQFQQHALIFKILWDIFGFHSNKELAIVSQASLNKWLCQHQQPDNRKQESTNKWRGGCQKFQAGLFAYVVKPKGTSPEGIEMHR